MFKNSSLSTNNTNNPPNLMIWAIIATVLSTLVYFTSGILSRDLLIMSDLNSVYYIAILFILMFPVVSMLLPEKWGTVSFYFKSTSLLIFLALSITALHRISLFAISLAPLFSYSVLWWISTGKTKSSVKKLITFSSALVFMYLAGSMFHLGPEPYFYPSTFASVSEAYIFAPGGVPYLLAGGIEFITPYVQGAFSPLSFLIFTSISAILTENYFGIFALLRRGNGDSKVSGTAYGAVSLLSCQCEGGVSLLPTMAYLVITIAMIPILAESLLLLLLTNVFVNRYYLNGSKVKLLSRISNPGKQTLGIIVAAILFLGTPLIETVGIYLGLITNIFFFFGIGILMTISAYYELVFLGRLIGYRRKLNTIILAAMFLLASALMFIWYFPHYTILAVEQVSIFLVMNITSIVAGVMFGLIKLSSRRAVGQLLEEFIALMFGMPPIIVFYLSALAQVQIYPIFSLTQQVEFGLIVWALILPFMWITTNISLNDAVENFTEPILSHANAETTGY